MLATINAALLLTNEQHGKTSNEPHHDALSVPAVQLQLAGTSHARRKMGSHETATLPLARSRPIARGHSSPAQGVALTAPRRRRKILIT